MVTVQRISGQGLEQAGEEVGLFPFRKLLTVVGIERGGRIRWGDSPGNTVMENASYLIYHLRTTKAVIVTLCSTDIRDSTNTFNVKTVDWVCRDIY